MLVFFCDGACVIILYLQEIMLVPGLSWFLLRCEIVPRVFIHRDDLLLQTQALAANFMAVVNRGTHTVLFKTTSNAYLRIDLHFLLNLLSNIPFKLH